MPQKIESDKLFVKDVFAKWYRVPEYQRPYVWDKDQVSELLDDIRQAEMSNKNSQYFLGSLVLRKAEKHDGSTRYEEYDLLDGQQRLTTLFLITAVIRDLTPMTNYIRLKSCKEAIHQIANPDDNIPERMRIIFDIREEVKEFVNEYVKNEGGTLKKTELIAISSHKEKDISVKNMAKALLTIHDYLSQIKIDDFYPFFRSNVLLIYVAAEELEDAFRLFTVMNNRGIKLRNSDILKAENLGNVKDSNKRTEFARKWEEIEKYFGEDFDNYISHLRTVLVKQKAAVSLVKEFEENIYHPKTFDRNTKMYSPKPPLLKKGEETFSFINRYFNHYQELFENTNYNLTNSFECHNYLYLMQKGFEADFWVAPLLRYYDKFKLSNLVPFIRALESKFAYDWIIGYTPTERIEAINHLIQRIDDSNTFENIISEKDFQINYADLKGELSRNIYGRRAAKYILLKLDLIYHGHTSKFDMPETISIEHILPQNPEKDSPWFDDYTTEDMLEWTDKIGNLVLISRRKNSSQGNKCYEVKKNQYFKNNIELFSNSVRIYHDYPNWKLADLKRNQEEVINKIMHGFKIN